MNVKEYIYIYHIDWYMMMMMMNKNERKYIFRFILKYIFYNLSLFQICFVVIVIVDSFTNKHIYKNEYMNYYYAYNNMYIMLKLLSIINEICSI